MSEPRVRKDKDNPLEVCYFDEGLGQSRRIRCYEVMRSALLENVLLVAVFGLSGDTFLRIRRDRLEWVRPHKP